MGFDRLYGRALRLSVSSGRPGFDRLYGRVLRLALHVVGGGPLVANVGLRVGIGASGRALILGALHGAEQLGGWFYLNTAAAR
jgi:hypothetical protein